MTTERKLTRDDFDDFVARKLQSRDVVCGAGHEVSVEDTKNRLVRNDQ